MSLRILVTDITSALGHALEHDLEKEQCKLDAPVLNWLDGVEVQNYLAQHTPDIVINTQGWEAIPDMDQLAKLPIVSTNIAKACAVLAVPLLHFSSYKVFGVDNKSSHSEKDIPAPASIAGQAFFAAEQTIEHSQAKAIILRLGWVIGSYGNNYLTRLLQAIRDQQPIELNSRLRGAPTLMSDVVRVAVAIVKQIDSGAENWGVMHYCSGDALSEPEFGEQLVQLLAQQQLLQQDSQITLVNYQPSDEPLSAVLGCRVIRDAFGIQARTWRQSLLPLVKQWFHNVP